MLAVIEIQTIACQWCEFSHKRPAQADTLISFLLARTIFVLSSAFQLLLFVDPLDDRLVAFMVSASRMARRKAQRATADLALVLAQLKRDGALVFVGSAEGVHLQKQNECCSLP